MAFIHIYTGPMASGKTSKMLNHLHKYSNVTKDMVLLINYDGDDRTDSSDGVSTHMYGDSSAKIPIGKFVNAIRVKYLNSLDEDFISRYSVIGIDESQFYPDLEEFIRKYSQNKGLTFHVSGLCFDSDNKPFGQTMNLLDIATSFEKMTAICSKCDPKTMIPAGFTAADSSKDSVVVIGGLDIYRPLCHHHYLENKN